MEADIETSALRSVVRMWIIIFLTGILLSACDSGGSDAVTDEQTPDTTPPLISIASPSDGASLNGSVSVTANVSDNVAVDRVKFLLGNVLIATDRSTPFSHELDTTAFANGSYTLQVTAFDTANNSQSVSINITINNAAADSEDPTVSITAPAEGATVSGTVVLSADASDNISVTRVEFILDGGAPIATDTSDPYGFNLDTTTLTDGAHTIHATAYDSAGNSADDSISVSVDNLTASLPPDPVDIAPIIDTTVATTLNVISEFLYTGSDPVQTGVADGTINPEQVAVLRGRVKERDGSPIPGVVISILNHDEFGQTLTRADGMFDLAVNGGGQFTVNYKRDGYLPVQRLLNVPWQDFEWLEDVVMIPVDSNVTTVQLDSSNMQVARGSQVTDIDGTRQATVLIPPATSAEVILGGGSTQSVSSLDIHITEYTVGDSGPNAMPGPLPPTSGYTYAIELTAEQAIKKVAGKDVLFNQPVFVYIDDFIGFPVGSAVPSGYYNADSHQWIASNNGRVIKVLGINGTLAELDTDGDDQVDDSTVLSLIGVTDAERQQLASLYSSGQTLWRIPITHFSTWDANWPISGPQEGSEPPNQPTPVTDKKVTKPECSQGSIIECQNQVLGESLPITGTPFTLNYRSDRTPGRKAAYSFTVPVTGDVVPAGLKHIELDIQIAGQRFTEIFQPAANLSHDFTWDGKNAYGITLQGLWKASIQLKYVYPTAYYPVSINVDPSFAVMGPQAEVILSRDASAAGIVQRWEVDLGIFDVRSIGLGGWSLSGHHVYFPSQHTLFPGSGGIRKVDNVGLTSNVFAGSFEEVNGYPITRYCGDDIPAVESCLNTPNDIEVAPDGSVYIADTNNQRIRRIGPQGVITTVAGTGDVGFSGDGGPAINAQLSTPISLEIATDGSLYIVDGLRRVRHIDKSGVITTVAGGGNDVSYDGGALAVDTELNNIRSIAIGPDNTLYIGGLHHLFRVGPQGFISIIAGTGDPGYNGDDIAATEATISWVNDIVLDLDGGIIFTDTDNYRVRRIGASGIITTIAGNGTASYLRDGVLATETGLEYPNGLAVSSDGSLYLTVSGINTGEGYLRHINQNGQIKTIAGSPWVCCDYIQQYMPATAVSFNHPAGIAINHDDSLLVLETGHSLIRRLSPPLESTSLTDFIISSEDGTELYVFDQDGRHLRTLYSLTGATLFEYAYDTNGLLQTITDGDGNITTIERDFEQRPTGIVSPYNQRTVLNVDAMGFINAITNPANETTQFTYTEQGLLTSMTDARQNTSLYEYNNLGRLVRTEDAAGGSKSLTRTTIENGYEVTLTTELGRVSKYRVEQLLTGEQRRLITYPDGTLEESVIENDGTKTITYPDGLVEIVQLGPDPRWGMAAPVLSSVELRSDSAGITKLLSESRSVTLSDPADIMSLTLLEHTFEVNNRIFTSRYDATTGQATILTPSGRQTIIDVDLLGRTTRSEVLGLAPKSFNYDLLGRLASTINGTGIESRTSTMTYDFEGFLISVIDSINQEVGIGHDQTGRITSLTRSDNSSIDFGYDFNGNLESLTPPGSPVHRFTYTPVNLQDLYTPPDVNAGNDATDYGYNVDRQLNFITRPDNQMISRGFDSAGRMATASTPRGVFEYGFDAITGNLVMITAPDNGTLEYSYTGHFLVAKSWSGSVEGSVEYTHDNNFRVASIGINGANVINKIYDNDGLLTQAGSLTLIRDVQHGLITATTLGAITDTRSHNLFAELESYSVDFNTTNLFDVQYTHDKLGRIISKTETIGGSTDAYDYFYDTVGRLSEVRQNTLVTDSYSYDSNGNRLSHNGVIGSYDDQDRLTSYGVTTYNYAANGELLNKTNGSQTASYNYDVLGNLTNVTLENGTTIEYIIDGVSRRIGKIVNNTLVQGFLYMGQLNPVAELDGNNNLIAQFVYGSKHNVPDYMIKGGNTYRIISDHLGSVRLVISTSDGSISQRMDYDAFGVVINDTNPGFQPFGFAGGVYDSLTGLVRFGARDYDPLIGRWTVKDPIKFFGGDTNLYSYVFNDPINLIDPAGKKCNDQDERENELEELLNKREELQNRLNNNLPNTDLRPPNRDTHILCVITLGSICPGDADPGSMMQDFRERMIDIRVAQANVEHYQKQIAEVNYQIQAANEDMYQDTLGCECFE